MKVGPEKLERKRWRKQGGWQRWGCEKQMKEKSNWARGTRRWTLNKWRGSFFFSFFLFSKRLQHKQIIKYCSKAWSNRDVCWKKNRQKNKSDDETIKSTYVQMHARAIKILWSEYRAALIREEATHRWKKEKKEGEGTEGRDNGEGWERTLHAALYDGHNDHYLVQCLVAASTSDQHQKIKHRACWGLWQHTTHSFP